MGSSSFLKIPLAPVSPTPPRPGYCCARVAPEPLLRVYCESCSAESVREVLEAARTFVPAGRIHVSGLVTLEVAGILFDMDGVLISSIGSVNRSWRRWAQRHDVPNAQTFQVPHGIRAMDIIAMLRPDLDPAEGFTGYRGTIEMVDTG